MRFPECPYVPDPLAATRRWRLRLSVRALMALVLVIACGLGWITNRGRVQQNAVDAIRAAGGSAYYSWELTELSDASWYGGESPEPDWLIRHLGPEYLDSISQVMFIPPVDYLPSETNGEPTLVRDGDVFLAALGMLPNVQRLLLAQASITATGLADLRKVSNLRELTLRDCRIDPPALFEVIREFRHLEKLEILGLPVTDSELGKLERLTSLREIRLTGSGITDAGLAHLNGLKNLERLTIFDGKVTGAGLAHLRGSAHLRFLGLHDGSGADLGAMEYHSSLEYLSLHYSPIRDETLDFIKDFPHLKTLHLAGAEITDVALVHLSMLHELSELRLEGTIITDEGLKQLAGLGSLTVLDLEGTRITDLGLVHLVGLQKLATLNVSRTAVTPAGILAAKRAHPGLIVIPWVSWIEYPEPQPLWPPDPKVLNQRLPR
jgi:hypothetical protein